MELRHIRYFIAAAEEQHFGRAADRLHVTRPAVSQIIADLEDEIGTLLFERHAHRVRLTAAGRALLPRLQVLMGDMTQALAMAKRIGEGKSGALNIGYGSLTLLHPLFRAAIKAFRANHPGVTLSLIEIATSAQAKALAEGTIHAGFMHFGPAEPDRRKRRGVLAQDETVLASLLIQTGRLGVVMLPDHPLAKRRSVRLPDLANEDFVVVPRSSVSPGYGALYALCRDAGFEPRIVQEVASIASQLNLVSVGMGIGLTVIGKGFVYPSELVVVPLADVDYTTSFLLGWVKGNHEPALEQLIAIVRGLVK